MHRRGLIDSHASVSKHSTKYMNMCRGFFPMFSGTSGMSHTQVHIHTDMWGKPLNSSFNVCSFLIQAERKERAALIPTLWVGIRWCSVCGKHLWTRGAYLWPSEAMIWSCFSSLACSSFSTKLRLIFFPEMDCMSTNFCVVCHHLSPPLFLPWTMWVS